MQELYCQSCGMPLENAEVMGTNKDESKNEDFCIYCYKDGNYTVDVSMREMIEISLKHMKELFKDDPNYNEQEALASMELYFPDMKRWKCTCTAECEKGYNPDCTCTSSECHCTEK